eukprot:scaffold5827_cov125-Isochrysis_galbana.AAC.3
MRARWTGWRRSRTGLCRLGGCASGRPSGRACLRGRRRGWDPHAPHRHTPSEHSLPRSSTGCADTPASEPAFSSPPVSDLACSWAPPRMDHAQGSAESPPRYPVLIFALHTKLSVAQSESGKS